jgi:hypothetical protein
MLREDGIAHLDNLADDRKLGFVHPRQERRYLQAGR